ncbi:MAG: ABC transporter permease [Angustibacter sp.]
MGSSVFTYHTATTAVSLMIGLTLVSAFAVLAASSKESVNGLIDDQVRADYVLTAASQPFSRNLVLAAARVPGVAAAVGEASLPVKYGKRTEVGAALSGAGLLQTVDVDMVSGDITSLDRGRIAVTDSFAKKNALSLGQRISIDVGVLPQQRLEIGAIFVESEIIGSQILVPESLYEKAIPATQQLAFTAFIRISPGADPAEVRAALVALVKPQLTISVLDREEFKESTAAQIDQILAIIYALLALSIVIATLGILNTLALSVFERTREIGLLRAIGLTRRQLRRTIAQEAILTALFGAVLGTVLGLVLGVLLREVLADEGLTELAIPWGQVGLTFLLAAVVGLLAAVWPAWRAARLDVIRAIGSA